MLRKLTLFSLIVSALVIVSCHKHNDVGGSSAQLVGNYKFVYITLQAQSTTQQTASGQTQKAVTYTNYKSVQNTGSVIFTKDSLMSKGVGYSVNTISTSYLYENGALTDSFPIPLTLTYPASNSATKYDVIGQDSILFHGGYFMSGLSGGTAIAPPSAGRFSFKGDSLFLISKFQQTNPPQTSGGITTSSSATGVATVVMVKQ